MRTWLTGRRLAIALVAALAVAFAIGGYEWWWRTPSMSTYFGLVRVNGVECRTNGADGPVSVAFAYEPLPGYDAVDHVMRVDDADLVAGMCAVPGQIEYLDIGFAVSRHDADRYGVPAYGGSQFKLMESDRYDRYGVVINAHTWDGSQSRSVLE